MDDIAPLQCNRVQFLSTEACLIVLVVDDDELSRRAIARSLRQSRIQIKLVEAENCAAAIAILHQQTIDCVVLDNYLPDGDGLFLIQQLQQQGIMVPVIALMEQDSGEDAIALMNAGIVDCFPKQNIASDCLCHRIQSAVRLYRTERQAAEAMQRLQESEERYRLILEGCNDGIWDWYVHENQVFCDDRFLEILGVTRQELGTSHDAYINRLHPEDRQSVLDAMAAHLQHGERFDVECRIRHASGTYRHCICRGKVLRDSMGNLFRMSGILSDITSRKLTENELVLRLNQQATIAKLGQQVLTGSGLTELMDQAVLLVADGLQVSYATVLEYLPDQEAFLLKAGTGWQAGVVGQTLVPTDAKFQVGYTFLSDAAVICNDLDREQRFHPSPLRQRHKLVSSMSVVIQTQEGAFGVLIVHSPTLRQFTQNDVDFLQAIANILASAIDQSRSQAELQQSQQDLQRRVDELQILFEVLPISISIADDPQCRTIRANPTYAKIVGIPPYANASKAAPEAERPSFKVLRDGQEVPLDQLPMEQTIAAGEPLLDLSMDILRADGTLVNMISYSAPTFDEQGKPRGCIAAFFDITARKQAELAQRFLAEASVALASSLDVPTILTNMAQLVVPELADVCIFDLLKPNGQLQRLVWKHRDPDKQSWFDQIQHYMPPPELTTHPVTQCLQTGKSVFVSHVSDDWMQAVTDSPERLQFMRDVGLRSLIVVPLSTHRCQLGILTLGRTTLSIQHYSSFDLTLAEDLAQRAAFALENARLYQLAQEAESNLRKALAILEQNQQQLRTLQQLADLLNQQITNLPNLLQLIVHAICEAVSTADFGMVLLQNPYTELLELAAATGIGDDFLHVYPAVVPGEGVLGELFLAGESRLIQDGSQELDASLPLSPASLCAVTIESAQAGKLGILVLGNWNNPAAFDADHLQLLLAFGEQAAIALTNAQLIRALEEREARLGLQNQMLSDQNQTLEIQQQHIQLQNLKLQEATQLKSEFIATMSHELRTPMNAVIGFSQLLLRQQGLSPKQADMVARILNNGRHLLSLINDILDFSKIEAGRLALNLEEMNLHHLMTETVEELRSLAEQKDLCLDIQIHLNDPIILNDRIRLRQVVINLISNAIKFTEVGTVRVTVQDLAADNLILSVQDTGIGIAKKDVHHIFEAFRQVDQSLAKSFPGTGLGLAITDLLVDSMHGSISVDSQVGQGSTFRVTFPRRVPQSLPSLADEE